LALLASEREATGSELGDLLRRLKYRGWGWNEWFRSGRRRRRRRRSGVLAFERMLPLRRWNELLKGRREGDFGGLRQPTTFAEVAENSFDVPKRARLYSVGIHHFVEDLNLGDRWGLRHSVYVRLLPRRK